MNQQSLPGKDSMFASRSRWTAGSAGTARARPVALLALVLAAAACRSPRGGGEKRRADRARLDAPAPPAPAPPASTPKQALLPGLPTPGGSTFTRDPSGETVYDSARDVTWLADANLPAKLPLGVRGVNPSGSMDYRTALAWVAALNAHEGRGYLGRKDWSLPTTPSRDPACSSKNRHSFGFGCRQSMFAGLYANALGLTYPRTAVPIPVTTVKGFSGLQPYLYWSGSPNANHPENENGYTTFSFANGFQGSNVSRNHIHVIPMIKGKVPGLDGKVIHDPITDVTWLANGNLAATESFGVSGIAPSGTMSHATAEQWVAAMNLAEGGKGYLGQKRWQLPPTLPSDPTCSAKDTFGFGCKGSPLGSLYYNVLGLSKGEPVVKAPDTTAGPFHNLEPNLYWSCHAADDGLGCSSDPGLPARLFAWSFSFGNGFQGTTMYSNALHVTVYHPGKHPR